MRAFNKTIQKGRQWIIVILIVLANKQIWRTDKTSTYEIGNFR